MGRPINHPISKMGAVGPVLHNHRLLTNTLISKFNLQVAKVEIPPNYFLAEYPNGDPPDHC